MEPYDLKRGAYKNLTLRLSPDGRLRVSAPWFLPRFAVDAFVAEKAAWIAERRRALPPRQPEVFPDSLSVWGAVLPLRVESPGKLPRVVVSESGLTLRVPEAWTLKQKRRCLDAWEKEQVAAELERLVPLWCSKMGLTVEKWTVKTLRSRWGSCRPDKRSLVFNSRLAELAPECLEHVVVHELVHLLEASHNARFHALVERWLPGSAAVRRLLRYGAPAAPDVSPVPPARLGEETAH